MQVGQRRWSHLPRADARSTQCGTATVQPIAGHISDGTDANLKSTPLNAAILALVIEFKLGIRHTLHLFRRSRTGLMLDHIQVGVEGRGEVVLEH